MKKTQTMFDYFMFAYMYQLEHLLQTKEQEILSIKFNLDEANTDRHLKEFIKNVIKSECSSLNMDFIAKELELVKDTESAFFNIEDLSKITINDVLLPEEITPEIKKELIKGKKSTYTNPDLLLVFKENNVIIYKSIELKSTTKNEIPGSSVQQINPDEWVIFVQHKKQSAIITTGKYIYSINSKLPFPDRSPRPKVAFSELRDWNTKHRTMSTTTLRYDLDSKEYNSRCEIVTDWHEKLCEDWINVLTTIPTKSSPWFHKVLRKFILHFLSTYEQLSPDEKNTLKKNIYNTISKEKDMDEIDEKDIAE